MDIRAKEDELFAKWRTKDDSFVVDGAPCPDIFAASPVRTVVMLKDINAPGVPGVFDLRRQLEEEPHGWWRTVADWCAAMSHFHENLSWIKLRAIPTKQCLEPFAFVQLKKAAGGGGVSNEILREYARRDANEIRAQLSIYQPQVIVCGGVGVILAGVLGEDAQWRETERGVPYKELSLDADQRTFLLDYMHPSVRARKNIVCYGLLDAYREIVARCS